MLEDIMTWRNEFGVYQCCLMFFFGIWINLGLFKVESLPKSPLKRTKFARAQLFMLGQGGGALGRGTGGWSPALWRNVECKARRRWSWSRRIWSGERKTTRLWFQIFFIFIPTWGDEPIWLIFSKWVETTNQKMTIPSRSLTGNAPEKVTIGP